MSGTESGQREVVFVSYSRKDADWRDRFLVMLAPVLERELEVWSDQREVIGEKWRPQLEQAIRRSRAALLLVSPDFVASQFIMKQELPALLQQGATPFYVLVRQCLWQKNPVLEEVQWAHDPSQALSQGSDRDGAIVEICMSLIERLSAAPAAQPTHEGEYAPGLLLELPGRVGALSAIDEGELVDVPPLPLGFVDRSELAVARVKLFGEGTGALGVTAPGLGLHGQGGIGKTVLAAAIARDDDVRRHFPDGVLWVTLGQDVDIVAAQRELLIRLGADADVRTAIEAKSALARTLADRQCLLIVDDVWSGAAAVAFRVTGRHGRVLYTTRDRAVLRAAEADVLEVDVLPDAAARQLLSDLAGMTVETLPAAADLVFEATGRVALALSLVGAALGRGGISWAALVEQLEHGASTFLAHPYANTFKAMQVALAVLSTHDAEVYCSLAVYPHDTKIPVDAIARYWTQLHGHTPAEACVELQTLADRKLVTFEDDTIAFHDLQRDFLLLQADDLALRHAELLAAYRLLLPATESSWAHLPPHEPYVWEHLVYHLQGAADGHGVIALVCDLAYLARRCFRDGPYAAESDVRQAAALYPEHEAIGWLLRLLAQWHHLFIGLPTVGDLAVVLWSRSRSAPSQISTETLRSLLPPRYLEPRWGLREPPAALARVLEGHAGGVNAVAFSPVGTQLASAGEDGTVRLWALASGEATHTLDVHSHKVNWVAFSPDGTQLATASEGTVQLWDRADGQPTHTLKGPACAGDTAAISPDGTRLAVVTGGGLEVMLWVPATDQRTHALMCGVSVNEVAFSPDGTHLAIATIDQTVWLWNPATRQLTHTLEGHDGSVNGVAFSPDGTLLATASSDRTVRLWDLLSGQLTNTLVGHIDGVEAVAFSPDGTCLATASRDETVRLWDPATGQLTHTLLGHTGSVHGVAFSPDSTCLATASRDGTMRLWHPATGQPTHSLEGHADRVSEVVFSPDGTCLATASRDGTVRLWDPATGQLTHTLEGHTGWANWVAFSPDGTRLATAGSDLTVRLWDPATGQPTHTLRRSIGLVLGIAFAPNDRRLATANSGPKVRLWDPASGQLTHTFESDIPLVDRVAFSQDGTRLATASDDDWGVRLWDLASGQLTYMEGDPGYVEELAFSPDGTRLAIASANGTVRLWDPASGQVTHTLECHTHRLNGVAFSPDGTQFATASDDGTVRVWDPGHPVPMSQLPVGSKALVVAWGASGIAVGTQSGDVIMLTLVDR